MRNIHSFSEKQSWPTQLPKARHRRPPPQYTVVLVSLDVVLYHSLFSFTSAFGAFVFGIGMQLGGGCASGTLFAVGSGNTRMLVTLLFFIGGSVLGINHLAWWQTLPSHAPVSLLKTLGWPVALALNVALFAIAYAVVARIERSRHGALESIVTIKNASWLRGPWPLLAVALALLNFATLYLAGRPCGITSAFVLWGGMGLQSVGVLVET